MDFCFVCGCELDKNGTKTIPLCETLSGHPLCFVSHQVFHVLNTGRADVCPSGEGWSIDWRASMKKYVKPQVAAEVDKIVTLLESNGVDVFNVPGETEGISQRILDAAKQGTLALFDLLTL